MKKTLKEHNPDLNKTLLDFIVDVDPTGGKMLPFLIKQLRKNEKYNNHTIYDRILRAFKDDVFYRENIQLLEEFKLLHEKGYLENKDLSSYNDWQDLRVEIIKNENKLLLKLNEKQVKTVFKNDEWLIIQPLSYEASVKYGYGTKWCTAMKDNAGSFCRYTKNGVLVYMINLKNGQKYGITNQYDLYTQKSEISCWDIMDDRIDTMIIDIEPEILKIVYKELQGDFTYSLMDDLNKKFVDENKDEYPILEEPGIATPEPMNELINPGGEIQYNDDTGLTTINHRMIYIGRLNSEQ